MSAFKLGTLLLRTVAKPITNSLKQQAKENESFRKVCIFIAQQLHRSEVRLRQGPLHESVSSKELRPLNEAKAIESGANFVAESFTFLLAAAIILYEQYRSRKQANRRKDYIDESLSTVQENQARINALAADIGTIKETLETMRETNVLIAEGLGRIVAAEKVSAMVNERLDRVLGLKELFGDDPTASQLVINIESGSNTAAGIRSEGDTQHLLDRLNIALGKTRKRGDDQEDRISEALSQVVG